MPWEKFIPAPLKCQLVPISILRLPSVFRTLEGWDRLLLDVALSGVVEPIKCERMADDGFYPCPDERGRVLAMQCLTDRGCVDFVLVPVVLEG